ncbi:MAG: ROK family protein [Planctomycetia bacterium]|nr:ROK family protein [Planctomycetia bacterium]
MSEASGKYAIGVDVGGTKVAAGLVRLDDGAVLARRLTPTLPERGGQAVLDDVLSIAASLLEESQRLDAVPRSVGVGLAELVSPRGEVLSAATIDWLSLAPTESLQKATGLTVTLEADVRAAALAEGRFGAGRDKSSFLYVTVGTGISAALVIAGVPYTGARGLTGTFASSPIAWFEDDGNVYTGKTLEQFAAGPAFAARLCERRTGFPGDARAVLRLAEAEDRDALWVVHGAAKALGAAIAFLVNTLDPEIVVIGGGLGAAADWYRDLVQAESRRLIWSDLHRELAFHTAAFGADAGLIGAAAATVARSKDTL